MIAGVYMSRSRFGIAWRALCAGTLVALAGAPTASADRGPELSDPIVAGLAGPLQFEVSAGGDVLLAQSFSGTVSTVNRRGVQTDLFNEPGVDGVSDGVFGSVIYTFSDFENGTMELRLRTGRGETRTIADTLLYETENNPDQVFTYGLQGLTDECAASLPADNPLAPYPGHVDSHPYAIAPTLFGWYVADAGSNSILFVDWLGNIRTVAVLPPQAPVEVTDAAAAANGWPPCTAGTSYVAEAVPTDVEIGPGGQLYVSALPGGPEDPSLGARGAVYRINPWTGAVHQIASGFAGAANLAVTPSGTIYVSELFGGQVSKVVRGAPEPVVSVPTPSGLEYSRNKLYVGANTFGPGELRTISL
jgi:hypothetical protein